MEYNKEQQEVLIQDFIDMLFVLRKFPKMSAGEYPKVCVNLQTDVR